MTRDSHTKACASVWEPPPNLELWGSCCCCFHPQPKKTGQLTSKEKWLTKWNRNVRGFLAPTPHTPPPQPLVMILHASAAINFHLRSIFAAAGDHTWAQQSPPGLWRESKTVMGFLPLTKLRRPHAILAWSNGTANYISVLAVSELLFFFFFSFTQWNWARTAPLMLVFNTSFRKTLTIFPPLWPCQFEVVILLGARILKLSTQDSLVFRHWSFSLIQAAPYWIPHEHLQWGYFHYASLQPNFG